MSRIPAFILCERCGKRAKLGLAANLGQFVKNAQINDKTRDQFRYTFGKKKASAFRTTKDVDAAFQDFAGRYPHLQPGFKRGRKYDPRSASDMRALGTAQPTRRDPFPNERITPDRRCNLG